MFCTDTIEVTAKSVPRASYTLEMENTCRICESHKTTYSLSLCNLAHVEYCPRPATGRD